MKSIVTSTLNAPMLLGDPMKISIEIFLFFAEQAYFFYNFWGVPK